MDKIQTTGKARRSQLVSTYGIGSIIDTVTGSYMPLGLDYIEKQTGKYLTHFEIKELRLQNVLNNARLYGIVIPEPNHISDWGQKIESYAALPVTRFPNWLECPNCHRLGMVGDPFEQDPDNKVRCVACRGKTYVNPVRFITACKNGHISDFPWVWWAHKKKGEICKNPRLYLKSYGKSSALGDLYVQCKNCETPPESLGSIFVPGAVKKKCTGSRPWLLDKEKCDLDVKTVQRGGSNIFFPIIASMISIPPESDPIGQLLRDKPEILMLIKNSVDAQFIFTVVKAFIEANGLEVDVNQITSMIREMNNSISEKKYAPASRQAEYQALGENVTPIKLANIIPEFENRVYKPTVKLQKWFDLIGAVNRIREVRACCGFARIDPLALNPEGIMEAVRSGKISTLSKESRNWFPAIEVHGEGVFLRFRNDKVKEWEGNSNDINNPLRMRANKLDELFIKRYTRNGEKPPYHITPRLLLVHSFAHLLIRRLSLDCGYSSSSLSERLYISESDSSPMCGVLVYTASSDSDGSLGGLVNLAKPERIEEMVLEALNDAAWCGSDPVCIESSPENSGERYSGASCHSCLLLPETACEKYNRELDRVTIIGIQEENIVGFFSNENS